jgi:hypothetical protein
MTARPPRSINEARTVRNGVVATSLSAGIPTSWCNLPYRRIGRALAIRTATTIILAMPTTARRSASSVLCSFCYCFHKIEELLADRRVRYPIVRSNEFKRLATGHWIAIFVNFGELLGVEQLRGRLRGNACAHLFEEVRERHVEGSCKIVEPARTHPIGATLVLLNLLERESERICQPFLTQSEQCPPQADAAADVDVNGIGEALTGHAAGRLALPFHVVTLFAGSPRRKVAEAGWYVNPARHERQIEKCCAAVT